MKMHICTPVIAKDTVGFRSCKRAVYLSVACMLLQTRQIKKEKSVLAHIPTATDEEKTSRVWHDIQEVCGYKFLQKAWAIWVCACTCVCVYIEQVLTYSWLYKCAVVSHLPSEIS